MSHILFCATDAGGVRNLVPLVSEVTRQGFESNFITRASLLPLFPPGFPRHLILLVEDIQKNFAITFSALQPIAVICGTTRHPSPDREFLNIASQAGVSGVAVMDEWYNYSYRFSTEGKRDCFPSAIALPDTQAVREAVADGLPIELCHATGSPSLSALWEIGDSWRAIPPKLPSVLEKNHDRLAVVFLSETHALDYGCQPGESGLMGPYIGYTETQVRALILKALSELPQHFLFLEKPHPSALGDESPKSVPNNVEYRLARGEPTLELCFHSDIIIGMRSMALLEARLLGCHVISFQPGLVDAERCTAVRLGLINKLNFCEELVVWLKTVIEKNEVSDVIKQPFFARADAVERVVQLALGDKIK